MLTYVIIHSVGDFDHTTISFFKISFTYRQSMIKFNQVSHFKFGFERRKMLSYEIFVCITVLLVTLLFFTIKVRNVVKNGNADKIHVSLFLRYDAFKPTTLFIINGLIFVFVGQAINIFIGLQHLNIIYHQIMPLASLMCLLVIGYNFMHIKHTVTIFSNNSMCNKLERWICGGGGG